jgi:hypothetical protein
MEQGTMMKVRMKTVADTPHADWRITQLMQQVKNKREQARNNEIEQIPVTADGNGGHEREY